MSPNGTKPKFSSSQISAGFGSMTDIRTASGTGASFLTTRPGALSTLIDPSGSRRLPACPAQAAVILLFGDRDSSGTSSLPDPGSEAGAGLIRQSGPQIKSRGLDARVKHGNGMGFDQCKPSLTIKHVHRAILMISMT
jgi:hypothetical protein